MSFTWYFLIKLSLISVVVGIINNENINEIETSVETKINHTLNALEINLLNRFIAHVDGKVSLLNNNIIDSNKNLEKRMTQKYKDLEENMTKRLDSRNELLRIIRAQLPCKEVLLTRSNSASPVYSIHSDTLDNSAVQRNSTGHLTHFEAHVALQADGYISIRLLNKENLLDSDVRYFIAIGCYRNQGTDLDKELDGHYATVRHNATPDILSASDFRHFYIKIDNGTLEFGKKGDISPIISYEDTSLGLVNYIQFRHADGDEEAKIRYDCPAPVK